MSLGDCERCSKPTIGANLLFNYCNDCIKGLIQRDRIFLGLEESKHITEKAYPEQTKRFREILDEMYRTHLDKNADYSPYNINVTGMRGLVTRLWDKSARFFSLMGLDIGTGKWDDEKIPANESINDTLIDWANYCVIAKIFREDKWAK